MGFTRKVLSVNTAGLIDFRSDKERVARSARLTKRQMKRSNKLAKKQLKAMKRAR